MVLRQKGLLVATWVVAGIVLVAGYARIQTHEVKRIVSAQDEASTLRARIDRSEAIVRDRVALRAARANIVADIGVAASHGGDGDLGPLLASLDYAAGRSGLAILGVEPDGAPGGSPKDDWLRSKAIRLVVRGSFSGFLTFLPELSNADPLILVRNVAIVPLGRPNERPVLVFTLGASAYTVRSPARKE
jgi:hypothetical protein